MPKPAKILHLLIIILTLLFISRKTAHAQYLLLEDVAPAKKFYFELKEQKVDSILIYGNGCIGCEVTRMEHNMVDSGALKQYTCDCPFGYITMYIIWTKQGKSYVKNFDYCSAYNTIEMKKRPDNLYNFYKQHLAVWQKEKVFDNKKIANNKKGKVIFSPPGPVHHSFDEVYFNKYEFRLPDYYFTSNAFNLYTWKNEQLAWVKLVKDLVKNYTFTPEK